MLPSVLQNGCTDIWVVFSCSAALVRLLEAPLEQESLFLFRMFASSTDSKLKWRRSFAAQSLNPIPPFHSLLVSILKQNYSESPVLFHFNWKGFVRIEMQ